MTPVDDLRRPDESGAAEATYLHHWAMRGKRSGLVIENLDAALLRLLDRLAAAESQRGALDVERLVADEAPYFRRLNPALRARGFQIAAYLTEHQKHVLRNERRSDCADCVAALKEQPKTAS